VCDNLHLSLRDEQRLKVFEKRVLKRIFGRKKEEVAGGWRRMHTENLHNLYASLNIIRKKKSSGVRLAGHVVRVER
jgi:hypothetical protein